MKRYKGIHDIYLHYRYLWRDINSRTVLRPYVSVEKISDHPYAMGISEWRKVVDVYMDLLFEELMEGSTVMLPARMGTLKMIRKKVVRRQYNNTPNGKVLKTYFNRHLQGYSVKVLWYRRKYCNMPFKFIFGFRPTRNRMRKVYKALVENPGKIYKLRED